MKLNITHKLLVMMLLPIATGLYSQEALTLQQALDAALQNNRGLQIKQLERNQKSEKINEDNIKRYPSVTANSTYQYNVNVGELTIEQGSFGSLPLSASTVIALPNENKSFELGNHHVFNAGVMLYQPLTQQAKIRTGIDIARNDLKTSEVESQKIVLTIEDAVQKLYYGLLINQRRQKEAEANMEAEKIRLYDVESALLAGKTIEASREGLQASIADKEQEIIKLEIEAENFQADLRRITLLPIEQFILDENTDFTSNATSYNPDEQLAALTLEKATLAEKAARQSNLPDVGIIGGYTYQTGNLIYPANNPYVGINLKWNLQDIFTNKSQEKQRNLQVQQARQNVLLTQETIANDTEKAERNIHQYSRLAVVAQKAVRFRKEELKIQEDRKAAGLNTKIDLLTAEASLAKAEADFYAAELGYKLAVSALNRLKAE